nr:MAG TPA: hypothetical protein [Caudoviricetes sp.]
MGCVPRRGENWHGVYRVHRTIYIPLHPRHTRCPLSPRPRCPHRLYAKRR